MEQQENRSYPSFSTSTPPIALSLLVLVVTTINLTIGIVLSNLSSDWLLNFLEEYGYSQIFLFQFLSQLLLFTPYFIVMLFVYLLLYKFTGDILRKEKQLNNVVYLTSRVLLNLWIFGVAGASCVRIIAFILTFDPESPIIFLLFSLLTDTYYILLEPLVPILVVFFRMAYEKTLDSQINMGGVVKAKSVSSLTSESPISILFILLTFISCIILPVLSVGGSFLYGSLIPLSPDLFFHLIANKLVNIVVSIISLFLYLGLGILTRIILENESSKNVRYSMKNSLFLLYLGGLLGALSYYGINILMAIVLSPSVIFVDLFYIILMEGLISLRIPLIPVLIVLVLIAHESLFSSQKNYEM